MGFQPKDEEDAEERKPRAPKPVEFEVGGAAWIRSLKRFRIRPLVSIVVPFLVNQFYGWDPIMENLVKQQKELQWRLQGGLQF